MNEKLLQGIREKNLLKCGADFESFIDGLEGAMMLLAEMAKCPEIKQIIRGEYEMKKRIIAPAVITACLALCAAV